MSGRLPSDGMPPEPLPDPESEQLAALLGDGTARLVYGLLYRRRSSPPTAAEIGLFLSAAASASMPADRVIRSLRTHFDITDIDRDGGTRYELRGWAAQHRSTGLPALSLQRRAQALAPGLCFQCGRSPEKHGVVLEVDLKVPPEWGGIADPENLQPLCEDCLKGKRQYQETYASYSEQIRHAADFDEPQRRIGELLLALQDEWVPSELIGIVASAKEYQTDYEKRTRNSGCSDGTTRSGRRAGKVPGPGSTTGSPSRHPGPRTYTRPSSRRRSAAGPLEERGLPAQTARCRLGSQAPRAARIAMRILAPTAFATGGGKALPTCRYEAVFRP